VFVFAMEKDVRVMTGALRQVDDDGKSFTGRMVRCIWRKRSPIVRWPSNISLYTKNCLKGWDGENAREKTQDAPRT
jgi:hypothetical protein